MPPWPTTRANKPAVLATLKARIAARHGADAETRAGLHLNRQGLSTIARNWRCPLGELDLVMADGETLVIVEVRARRSSSHGGALESVDVKKRGKLLRTTLAFVQAHPQWQQAPIRFDLVHFEADGKGRWLRDAFTADECT